MALNPLQRIFLNFALSCLLLCWSQFDNNKWGLPCSFLSYKSLKLKKKGVLGRSYCCYGKLLCHKMYSNMFINDCAVLIPWIWHQPIYNGYNDQSKAMSWKVLETVLSHFSKSKWREKWRPYCKSGNPVCQKCYSWYKNKDKKHSLALQSTLL